MTAMSVVIPWQGGCEHRAKALAWVLAWWARHHPHAEVVIGAPAPPGSVWCKARAVHHALLSATGERLVVADADVVTARPEAVTDALDALDAGNGWAVPHTLVHRLGERTTARLVAGTITEPDHQAPAQKPYAGWLGGGMVVLPADAYQLAPLDERFEGWGQEDEAWAAAMTTMLGPPWRGDADLWHLWHPSPRRRDRRYGSTAGKVLVDRYHAAGAAGREAMAELIEEGRAS